MIIKDTEYIEKVIEFFEVIKKDSCNVYKEVLEGLLDRVNLSLQAMESKKEIMKDIEQLKDELEESQYLNKLLDNISNSNTLGNIKDVIEELTNELNSCIYTNANSKRCYFYI